MSLSGRLILDGDLPVIITLFFDGFAFNPFSLFNDGFSPTEVDIDIRALKAFYKRI
jgi:hypothetical protein